MRTSENLEDCGWLDQLLTISKGLPDTEEATAFLRLYCAMMVSHFRRARFLLEEVQNSLKDPQLRAIIPQFPASQEDLEKFKKEWEEICQWPIFRKVRFAIESIQDEDEKRMATVKLLEIMLYLADFLTSFDFAFTRLSQIFELHNLNPTLLRRLKTAIGI